MTAALRILLLFTVSLIDLANAEEDTLDYFYTPQVGIEQQPLVNRMFIHARNTEFENALASSRQLISETQGLQQASPLVHGQLLVNHGILLSASGEYEQALPVIEEGITYLEEALRPFSEDLINAVMAKGLTEMSLRKVTAAEDSFRRAQHITHRQDGVYSGDQLIMLNYLTTTSLQRGAPEEADKQQLFSLRVAENVYGEASTAILPTLSRLGSYFAARGSSIPVMAPTEFRMQRDLLFRDAITMYERALAIVAENYGENDIRLVPHLRGLANARMLQITARRYAEEALQRSLAIIESQPNISVVDHAQAYIDLGDLYIILSDERAEEYYLKAWDMLQETEPFRDLAASLFGVPTRLHPRNTPVYYLERMPDAAADEEEMFVDLEYDISEDGRVRDVRVIDRNVPNEQVRLLRQQVRAVRYRPRMEDGTLVATEGLQLHQLFRVLGDGGEDAAPDETLDKAPADEEVASTLPDDELP